MTGQPPLLDHARAAVERTARSLAALQASLDAPSAARLGRQHRLLIESALHDLARRQDRLASLYTALLDAPEERQPECWQRFFACYDDYLEASRDARSRLTQNGESPGGTPPRGARGGLNGRGE